MAYDANFPPANAELKSAEFRTQFQGLKALLDGGSVPIGCVLAFCRDQAGVPALPAHWAECNGQLLADPESPLDGQYVPDLNLAGRFLKGGDPSGSTGGQDYFGTATADYAGVGAPFAAVTGDYSPGATPFPPFFTVVWVMRVR